MSTLNVNHFTDLFCWIHMLYGVLLYLGRKILPSHWTKFTEWWTDKKSLKEISSYFWYVYLLCCFTSFLCGKMFPWDLRSLVTALTWLSPTMYVLLLCTQKRLSYASLGGIEKLGTTSILIFRSFIWYTLWSLNKRHLAVQWSLNQSKYNVDWLFENLLSYEE